MKEGEEGRVEEEGFEEGKEEEGVEKGVHREREGVKRGE